MNTEVCIGVYYLLLVIFGISQYFLVQPPESVDINWFKDVISDIQIIKDDQQCSNSYTSLLSFYWPGIKSGQICENVVQENQKSKKTMNCKQLREIPAKIFDTFAQIEPRNGLIQPFKVCGKKLTSVNLFSSKSLEEEVCNQNQLVCFFEGKVFCIEEGQSCQQQIDTCLSQNKICSYQSTILCINPDEDCPQTEGICKENERSCLIKERIICVDQEEKCPITDIIVINQNEIISNLYEKAEMSFQSEWKFYVKRDNIEQSAIVEFQISSSFGVCLNHNYTTEKYINSLEKQQPCRDLTDTRYLKFLQHPITAKQLYYSNKVNLAEHSESIPSNQKYDLFYRRYFGYSNECNFSNQDITRLLSLQRSIKDFSLGFFWCSIVLFITFIDLKRIQADQQKLKEDNLYFSKRRRNKWEIFYSWHIGVYIINLFYITCLQVCISNVNYEVEPLLKCDDPYLQRDVSQYILESEGEEIIHILTLLYWFPVVILLYKIILQPQILNCKCFNF